MTIHIDFETRSVCDLRVAGAHKYAENPTTDVWCMAYVIGDAETVELWAPGDPWPDFDMSATFMAHNAQFELAIWNSVMNPRYGWPAIMPEQMQCTMAMAYAMALPGSLEQAASAVGLEVRKDMEGRNLMLRMAKPRSFDDKQDPIWWDDEERLKRLYEYCRQDVVVERELEKRLRPLSKSEQALWVLDQRINSRGIPVDTIAIERAADIISEAQRRADAQMLRITGGWVRGCTKVQDLMAWLATKGVETSGVGKADVTDLLERDNLPEDVREALELRKVAGKSSTAKLKSMLNAASEDGRCRGVLQYHGASTGRWAGRRIQPQNFPRPDMSQHEIEQVLELISA